MTTNELLFPMETSILSSDAIKVFLQKEYRIPISVCRLFYRSIHDTYMVQSNEHNYFFKVYRFGLRSKEDIQLEIDWILQLLQSDIAVTKPVQKQDGSYIVEFNTVQGKRYGVLFTSVGEKSLEEAEETSEINSQLGKCLAMIQRAWDFVSITENNRKLDVENVINQSMNNIRNFHFFHHFDIDFLETVSSKLKDIVQLLSKNSPAYGICHGDFYSGNIRLNSVGQPILFDFDFSGTGWRMYDIALYANAFGLGCSKEGMVKREQRKAAFMSGYSKVQSVSDEMLQSMDLFVPYRRIFNIGTIYCGMSNTFGDHFAIHNTTRDIEQLKRWLELNPVL